MRILGIDPGTATTGFGLIDVKNGEPYFIDCGVIVTPAKQPMQKRLVTIAKDLRALIRRHRPDVVAIEELFFAKNVTNALSVGQARGVVLLIAQEAHCEVVEYKPHHIKLAVAGYGRATKQQVQRMVQQTLRLSKLPKPDDAADGLAVAITHAVTKNR